LFLVYLAFRMDFQMAEDNYYSREKEMNKYLEGRKNTAQIGDLFTTEKKGRRFAHQIESAIG